VFDRYARAGTGSGTVFAYGYRVESVVIRGFEAIEGIIFENWDGVLRPSRKFQYF